MFVFKERKRKERNKENGVRESDDTYVCNVYFGEMENLINF